MAFECEDSFAINYTLMGVRVEPGDMPGDEPTIIEDCTLEFDDMSTITIPRHQSFRRFEKRFRYTLGSNVDHTVPGAGWALAATGTGVAALDVTYTIIPTAPNFDPNVPEPRWGLVDMTVEVDRDRVNALYADEDELSFTVTLEMNTGGSTCRAHFTIRVIVSTDSTIAYAGVSVEVQPGFVSQWFWRCRFIYTLGDPAATGFSLSSADGLTGTFRPRRMPSGNAHQLRNGSVEGIINLIPNVELPAVYNGTVFIIQPSL